MDQIADIPVKDPNGKLIGKARIEKDRDRYVAHINIDPELGSQMVSAMTEGLVTGLSVGSEIAEPVPYRQIGGKEIENRFGFHKATIEGKNATVPVHVYIREEFTRFAKWLDGTLPGSREKDLAFDFLETGAMWAHKSVARTSPRTEG
jgi:hypothetical protein